MSQLVSVDTQITCIDSLREAAASLGLALTEGGEARYYGGKTSGPCDYVIKLPGKYDLGFRQQADGSYALVADNELLGGRSGSDNYGRNDPGRKLLGEDARHLRRAYTLTRVARLAKSRGRRLQNLGAQADGRIKLVLS
jgi:hypothetical protein